MHTPFAWAKYNRSTNTYMHLTRHMHDTCEVISLLLDTWAPRTITTALTTAVGTPALARKTARFLAAGHDIGKASSAFAHKAPELLPLMKDLPLVHVTNGESKHSPHSIFSATSLLDYLNKIPVSNPTAAATYATVVAGHHGIFPKETSVKPQGDPLIGREKRSGMEDVRGQFWQLAADMAELSPAELAHLATTPLPSYVQDTLTGLVIMSDWIASHVNWFPLEDTRSSQDRARQALAEIDLPTPWQPSRPGENPDQWLRHVTSLPAPRPVQTASVNAALDTAEPGLLLIEAPPGEGKTEAALAAAEIMANTANVDGLVWALPTQATANAMYDRISAWAERRAPHMAATLLHSRADYYLHPIDTAFTPKTPGEEPELHTECGTLPPKSFFDGSKTQILRPCVVSTIDQVISIALRSRHNVLRQVGVAGKVVVLDEIHASDRYMDAYIERTLEILASLAVPVIAMSATVSPEQRTRLCNAYRRGRGETSPSPAVEPTTYPSVTMAHQAGVQTYPVDETVAGDVPVELSYGGMGCSEIARLGVDAVRDGGCVLVVCNAVARAIETARLVSGDENTQVVCLHSRFTAVDRTRLERTLIGMCGPQGARPERLIVVATQVVESSLDLDFDHIISDIAPMDSLLQRMGRLHRHAKTHRPDAHKTPRLHITGCSAPTNTAIPDIHPSAEAVYGKSRLLRAMAALNNHPTNGVARSDTASLINAAYADKVSCPSTWKDAITRADTAQKDMDRKARQRAETYLLPAPGVYPVWDSSRRGTTLDELEVAGRAQVRDMPSSHEVVLVVSHPDGTISTVDGNRTGLDPASMSAEDQRLLAGGYTVTIPGWAMPPLDMLPQLQVRPSPSHLAHRTILRMEPDGNGGIHANLGRVSATYASTTGLELRKTHEQ